MHISIAARFIGPFVVLGNLLEELGDAVAPHEHPYSHISYVVTGRVRLTTVSAQEGTIERDCPAGEPFFVPPHTAHSFVALEPDSRVDCIVVRSDWDARPEARTPEEC